MIPLAELHCHLEGAAGPALVRRLAARNGVALPETIFADGGRFAFADFVDFLRVYDVAAGCIRTPNDYYDVTFEYLAACAREGVIYVELMSSPDHAAAAGMTYADHLEGIVAAIADARRDHDIEGRIIVTCVRHFGPERAVEVARQVVADPHPLVVGFGMGGDESAYAAADFASAFRLVNDSGLLCTVHAGEFGGPESVRAALAALPVSRLGHGVRAIEDADLVRELADRGVVLEVCPTSNVATGVYGSYAAHPLKKLIEAGCRVTLNSDDPPYFGTSVGREYRVGADEFDLSETDLAGITRTAIEAGFADDATKAGLLRRVDDRTQV